MNTKKSEFIVGLIIILAILIVILGKVVITGTKQKSEMTEVIVRFSEIGGLEVGNAVFIHGVRAGKVSDIILEQEDVLVKLLVNCAITLKKDARIVISERGMMGEREISINPGTSKDALDITQIVKGYYNVGFNETISQIGTTIENINALSTILKEFVGDEEQIEIIKGVFVNLDRLLATLNLIFEKNKDITIEYEHINNILSNLDSLISVNDEKVERIITFAEDKTGQIDLMLNQMQVLLNKLERDNTDLGRLTANDSLYQKIDRTIANFDSLVTDIKKNPKHYFKIF